MGSKELLGIAPGQVQLREYTEAPLAGDEVRVRTELSAEKHGTTLMMFKGESPFSEKVWDPELELLTDKPKGATLFPMRLGNMSVGTVVATGDRVDKLGVGDRVYGYLPIRETHTVNQSTVEIAPKELKNEQLVCVDPAVLALMGVREARCSLGDQVAVFGLGAIGLLCVQMARQTGATCIVGIDPIPERRSLAKIYGADLCLDPANCDVGVELKQATRKKGVDASIECSGDYQALQQASRGTRYGGTVVPVSWYYANQGQLNLAEEWHFNRQVLVAGVRSESEPYRDFPRWDRQRLYETVIHLLANHRITVDDFLTIVSVDQIEEAYRTLVANPTHCIKLAVDFRDQTGPIGV